VVIIAHSQQGHRERKSVGMANFDIGRASIGYNLLEAEQAQTRSCDQPENASQLFIHVDRSLYSKLFHLVNRLNIYDLLEYIIYG
jgi:hypothetical protein